MLIYVIPLVILIIVLIIVKKRQDAQESGSDKAKTKTVKAKKPGSAAKLTPPKTKAVEPAVIEEKNVTPLSADTRKKIKALIQERNFFAAEAQINQALNRDNSQHDLYLLLLDIHILQKDEFAISQLINHIRSLELDNILTQAKIKQREFEKSIAPEQKSNHVSSPVSSTLSAQDRASANEAFSDLASSSASNKLAFEQLQQELQPSKAVADTKAAADSQPLGFNFQAAPATAEPPAVVTKPAQHVQPLEFNLETLSAPAEQPAIVTEPTQNVQPLEFNLATASASAEQPAIVAEPAQNMQPLEFNFETAAAAVAPAKAEEPVAANNTLEFGFQETAPEIQTTTTAESAAIPDFKLELEPAVSEILAPTPAASEEIQPLDFSFSLDTPVAVAEKTAEPPVGLDLNSTTSTVAETPAPVEAFGLDFNFEPGNLATDKPVATGLGFDLAAADSVQAPTDQTDPLVQSFPELMQVNEASLNLGLAQQYIQLGAYVAAREVIAERESEYTPEQRQQADQLLNQIAS
jgi:FimV-like protein